MSLFVSALCSLNVTPIPDKPKLKTPYLVTDVALGALFATAGILVLLATHKIPLGPLNFMAQVPYHWGCMMLVVPVILFLFDMSSIPIFLKQKAEAAKKGVTGQLQGENIGQPVPQYVSLENLDIEKFKAKLKECYTDADTKIAEFDRLVTAEIERKSPFDPNPLGLMQFLIPIIEDKRVAFYSLFKTPVK